MPVLQMPADYAICWMKANICQKTPLAAEYYASAATAGRLPAQLRLAELYSGLRLPMIRKPDLTGCYAAEQGDMGAAHALADAYLLGNGVAASPRQALFWRKPPLRRGGRCGMAFAIITEYAG